MARPVDSKDTWGDLPERAKAVFSAQGGGDMPVQYRGWIDSYYKRLNQRR